MTIKFTPTNSRTIAQHGEEACRLAFYRNRVIGEGGNTVGGGDTRLGDNLINAGEKLVQREMADTGKSYDEVMNPSQEDL